MSKPDAEDIAKAREWLKDSGLLYKCEIGTGGTQVQSLGILLAAARAEGEKRGLERAARYVEDHRLSYYIEERPPWVFEETGFCDEERAAWANRLRALAAEEGGE